MFLADRFRLLWTPFLKKQRSGMLQAVGLVFPCVLGSGGELTLHVGKRKFSSTRIDLTRYPSGGMSRTDQSVYLWLVPRPARPMRLRAAWKAPSGRVHRDSLLLKPAEPTAIHVIFSPQVNRGGTARLDQGVRLYPRRLMDELLDYLDKTADRQPSRRLVWTLSARLLEQFLNSKQVGSVRLKRLEHYIRRGRIAWGLTPVTGHTEFLGLEELCRSTYAARRLAERFGLPVPTSARMTGVPAHPAALAMALAAAGGRFLQIAINRDCLAPAVPPLFWWKLPDGNRVLCHYQGAYGTPLLPPPQWPWRQWASIRIPDEGAGPQILELIDHLDWIEAHFDWPRCRTGRLEDFAVALIGGHGKTLPVVEKEFVDGWIHGLAGQATATARRDKGRLASAEILGTLAGWSCGRSVPAKERTEIRDAYEQLALHAEHPEGGSAEDAGQATDRVVARAVQSFAGRLRGRRFDPVVVLFNTVSWSRGGLVRLPDDRLPARAFELVDATTGGVVLYERRAGWIEFVAPPVPPCGYLMLAIRPATRRSRPGLHADWDERMLTLHTNAYALQFHTAGGMARWHDRARSCQWCSDKVEFPMGTYLYEMPGGERLHHFIRRAYRDCPTDAAGLVDGLEYDHLPQFGPVGGAPATIHPEIRPLYARVVVQAKCPARKAPHRRSGDAREYRTTFTTYRGQRDLHVNVRVLGKRAASAPEAGYAFFPFASENPFVLVERIAQLIEPGEDLARGVNAAHLTVHHGLRIEGTHAGMNFYPRDTPLVGFGAAGAYRFDDNGKYRTGVLYATLFNNCPGTNFARRRSGDLSFDFVLRPTANDEWDGDLARGGAEVFRPLLAAIVPRRTGSAAGSLLRVDPACVQLVALKPAEFGPGRVMRLWNADVDPIKARLTLPKMRRGDKLWWCDLLERPTKRRIRVSGEGEAAVHLQPNEIATLLLQPTRAGQW